MISASKLRANRANSRRSTGPKTTKAQIYRLPVFENAEGQGDPHPIGLGFFSPKSCSYGAGSSPVTIHLQLNDRGAPDCRSRGRS